MDVTYDPDRVLRPLRRRGEPGDFEHVSWAEAMGEITGRMSEIRRRHGPESLATFMGNPPAFSVSAAVGVPSR